MASEGTEHVLEFYERMSEVSPLCASTLSRLRSNPDLVNEFARIIDQLATHKDVSPEVQRMADAVGTLDAEDFAKLLFSDRVEVKSGEQRRPQVEAVKAYGPCVVENVRIIYMHYKGRRIRKGYDEFQFPDDPEARIAVRTIAERVVAKESFSANKDAIIVDGKVLYNLDPKREMWGMDSMEGAVITNDMYDGYVGEM